MKIKLDENFDLRLVPLLESEGHDVDNVYSEGISGSDDETIFKVCCTENRVLIRAVGRTCSDIQNWIMRETRLFACNTE